MCAVEKMIACQVSFIPVGNQDYNADITKVLKIIRKSGLQYQIGVMSTVVQSSEENIFRLLRNMFLTMDPICSFVMDIRISNVCGSAG